MTAFGIDTIIFSGFLLIYALSGLLYNNPSPNIHNYTNLNQNFPTSKIVATTVSGWLGGGFIFYTFIESYRLGLYFIIPHFCDGIMFILIGKFMAPRMSEFLGKLSMAEILGELFGIKVKVVSAVVSIITGLGLLAAQLKVTASLFEIFWKTSHVTGIMLSGFVAMFYSMWTKIKIATFSDMIQFITFSCLLPILTAITLYALNTSNISWQTLITTSSFNPSQVFDLHNQKSYSMLGLCILFITPKFGPVMFQAIAMSKNTSQSSDAYTTSGYICLAMGGVLAILGTVMFGHNPNFNPNNLFAYCLDLYTSPYLRSLIAICILTMVMTLADFMLNTTSISFARDICHPIGLKINTNLAIRAFIPLASLIATYIALKFNSILSIIIAAFGYHLALIAIPFILAVFGFRSSGLSVLIGMMGSIITMVAYQYLFAIPGIDFFIPGMIANTAFLFGSHYFLKQPKGWIGIKGEKEFVKFQQEKTRSKHEFLHENFGASFLEFFKQGLPCCEANVSLFGLFGLISIFLNQISLPENITNEYFRLTDVLYPSALILCTNLVFYPTWPAILKRTEIILITWFISILYISIVVPVTCVLISDFLPMQMIGALINLIAVFVLLKWNISLFLVFLGIIMVSLQFYYFTGNLNIENLQFQLSYLLLFASAALIGFFKNHKQVTNSHHHSFTDELHNLSRQTLNSLILKRDFINSFNQEIKNPIENIGIEAATLHSNKNNLDQYTRDSVELVYNEVQKLQSYVNEDLPNVEKIMLDYQYSNFQELIENVVNSFNLENIRFKINLQTPHLIVTCDVDKIFQAIKYLIQNTINSSQIIEIKLEDDEKFVHGIVTPMIKCSIIDEGTNLSEDELKNVFSLFNDSCTKTHNISLELALCQRIIELHHGTIWAESNKTKPGATFSFIIPRTQIS